MELYFPRWRNVDSDLPAAVRAAFDGERAAGRIAADVRLSMENPRVTRNGEYIKLAVHMGIHREPVPGEGRRRETAYGYGIPGGFVAAATFDEYGWLLSGIYRAGFDRMVVGRPARPVYEGVEDFHVRTGDTYDLVLAARGYFGDGSDDPYPFVSGKSQPGYFGRGRSNGDVYANGNPVPAYVYRDAMARFERGEKGDNYFRYAPRTAAQMAAFARVELAPTAGGAR